MKRKIIVLNSKDYDFTNENGKNFKGTKLSYTECEPLLLDTFKGCPISVTKVQQGTLTITASSFPCLCEIESVFLPNSKGQNVEYIKSITSVKALSFNL